MCLLFLCFRETVRSRVHSGQGVDDLTVQLVEHGRQRQEQLDAHDTALTAVLCENFSSVNLAEDINGAEQTIFASGMSDVKVNTLRGLLGLPPIITDKSTKVTGLNFERILLFSLIPSFFLFKISSN